MTRSLILGVLLMAVFAQTACGASAEENLAEPAGLTKLAELASADRITLHEGLPHQLFERKLLESERRSKPVRELDGYPFYQAPLAPSAEDTKRLTQLLADPATYHRFSGEKNCGDFHPDYAVEWQKDSNSYRLLICFGCGEAKLFGSRLDQRYDLDGPAKSKLAALLGSYHQNRPPSRYSSVH